MLLQARFLTFGNSSGVRSKLPGEQPHSSFLLHDCEQRDTTALCSLAMHDGDRQYTNSQCLLCGLVRTASRLHNLGHCEPVRPVQLVLIVPVVQTVSEPDAPNNVEVSSSPSHQMPVAVNLDVLQKHVRAYLPPTMALQHETPGHTNLVSPFLQLRAVFIVEVPQ